MVWLLRLPLVAGHLLLGVLVALCLTARPGRTPSPVPMAWWSRWLCRLLGVHITVQGRPCSGSALFVANHVSWLDIMVIAAVCPTHFLAKREVAGWPLLGWLCRRVGTAFISRGGRDGAARATEELVWRLRREGRVLIFPEGTSTDGQTVRRFHSRLFQAAVLAGRPVQALAVRYPGPAGLNRRVPFVGDDAFLPHLWRLLGERRVEAELCFCPPLATPGVSRDWLARTTQAQVVAALDGMAGRPPTVKARAVSG